MSLKVPTRQANGTSSASTKAVILVQLPTQLKKVSSLLYDRLVDLLEERALDRCHWMCLRSAYFLTIRTTFN